MPEEPAFLAREQERLFALHRVRALIGHVERVRAQVTVRRLRRGPERLVIVTKLLQHSAALFEQALLPTEYEDREGGLPGQWAPAVDVIETEDAYLLFAELPGVRKEDIQLSMKDRRLELLGRRQSLGENRNFLRMERSYGPSPALPRFAGEGAGRLIFLASKARRRA